MLDFELLVYHVFKVCVPVFSHPSNMLIYLPAFDESKQHGKGLRSDFGLYKLHDSFRNPYAIVQVLRGTRTIKSSNAVTNHTHSELQLAHAAIPSKALQHLFRYVFVLHDTTCLKTSTKVSTPWKSRHIFPSNNYVRPFTQI